MRSTVTCGRFTDRFNKKDKILSQRPLFCIFHVLQWINIFQFNLQSEEEKIIYISIINWETKTQVELLCLKRTVLLGWGSTHMTRTPTTLALPSMVPMHHRFPLSVAKKSTPPVLPLLQETSKSGHLHYVLWSTFYQHYGLIKMHTCVC